MKGAILHLTTPKRAFTQEDLNEALQTKTLKVKSDLIKNQR